MSRAFRPFPADPRQDALRQPLPLGSGQRCRDRGRALASRLPQTRSLGQRCTAPGTVRRTQHTQAFFRRSPLPGRLRCHAFCQNNKQTKQQQDKYPTTPLTPLCPSIASPSTRMWTKCAARPPKRTSGWRRQWRRIPRTARQRLSRRLFHRLRSPLWVQGGYPPLLPHALRHRWPLLQEHPSKRLAHHRPTARPPRRPIVRLGPCSRRSRRFAPKRFAK